MVVPAHELESLRRRGAFAGRAVEVDPEVLVAITSELLELRHRTEGLRAELAARLDRLSPTFREVRSLLNEIDRIGRQL